MTGVVIALLLVMATALLTVPSGRSWPPTPSSGGATGRGSGVGDAALVLDLLGALLTAGSSVERALSIVSGSCEPRLATALAQVNAARMLGASWEAAWDAGSAASGTSGHPHRVIDRRAGPNAFLEVREGLRFATSTGAPSAALLHAHSAQLRRRHNREVDRRAAALGVQLVLPLGLCSLPAFICLGVVPVVLGLLPEL
jgi:hypothetical protein